MMNQQQTQHQLMVRELRRAQRSSGLEGLPDYLQYVADMTPIVEARQRLQADIKASRERRVELGRELRGATAKDGAAALRGESLPKRSAADVKAEIVATERAEAAAGAALGQLKRERGRMLTKNRERYLAEIEAAMQPARDEINAALDETMAAFETVASLNAARQVITTGADIAVAARLPMVDTKRVDMVIAELRAAAAPPPPPRASVAGKGSAPNAYEELVTGQRRVGTSWTPYEELASRRIGRTETL
jgi:hypothetical protein